MRYDKLIRDKIPERIENDGAKAVTHIADDAEYSAKLKEKLQEEVGEFLEEENAEELTDVLEVIYAIRDRFGISAEDLEKLREKKKAKRGGFEKRIILESIDDE